MASYISTKKKELYIGVCNSCMKKKNIVSSIRNDKGVLYDYCHRCFEEITGRKVSKR